MDWPTSAAIIASVALLAGALVKIFGRKEIPAVATGNVHRLLEEKVKVLDDKVRALEIVMPEVKANVTSLFHLFNDAKKDINQLFDKADELYRETIKTLNKHKGHKGA